MTESIERGRSHAEREEGGSWHRMPWVKAKEVPYLLVNII
jgi:hypothetical protein